MQSLEEQLLTERSQSANRFKPITILLEALSHTCYYDRNTDDQMHDIEFSPKSKHTLEMGEKNNNNNNQTNKQRNTGNYSGQTQAC